MRKQVLVHAALLSGRCVVKGRFLGALELLFGSHKHRPCLGLCIQALHPVASIKGKSSKRDARTVFVFFLKLSFFAVFLCYKGIL